MRLAFTATALFQGIHYYGEKFFKLTEKYGNLIVHEYSIATDPVLKDLPLTNSISKSIMEHWFNFQVECSSPLVNQFTYLKRLDKKYPDDLIVFVGNLAEFSVLNRTYGEDCLKSIEYIGELLK